MTPMAAAEENLDDLMTVDQAIALIDALPVTPRTARLPLMEAVGLRLAEDIFADRDYPQFDKSLMDGYAVRSADVSSAAVELEVIGESAAGQMPDRTVGPGQAMAIMTGAPVPAGADAVVAIEKTGSKEFAKARERVRILAEVKAGQSVACRGSDVKAGTKVLSADDRLNPQSVAVAACVGATAVLVHDRAHCAVFATGNELVAADQSPQIHQLRNSNNPMLVAVLKRHAQVRDLGIAVDDPAEIAARLQDALNDDIVFITGGMSMGQYDYVPRILREMGGELLITKLRIKPGKPFMLAKLPGGKYVVGLPGNPVSAFVCTVRLVLRLVSRMNGVRYADGIFQVLLAEPLPANGPREFYLPASTDGFDYVFPLKPNGSADIFTLAKTNALIIRSANAPAIERGRVPVMWLYWK